MATKAQIIADLDALLVTNITGDISPEELETEILKIINNTLNTDPADTDIVTQGDAEAGTATDPKLWTAERVSQAIAALGADPTKIESGSSSVETFAAAVKGYVATFQFLDAISAGNVRDIFLGDVVNSTILKVEAPTSGSTHKILGTVNGEQGLKVEDTGSGNILTQLGSLAVVETSEAADQIKLTAGTINIETAPTTNSDGAGKVVVREDSGGNVILANFAAFQTLEGAGAPVDGTTKAWRVGQIYVDTSNDDFYRATAASTDPDSAATGSTWVLIATGGGGGGSKKYAYASDLIFNLSNVHQTIAGTTNNDWDAVAGAGHKLDFSSLRTNTTDGITITVANDEIEIDTDGRYVISAEVTSSGQSYRFAQIVKNGTTVLTACATGNSSHESISMNWVGDLVATDIIDVRVDANGTGNVFIYGFSISVTEA